MGYTKRELEGYGVPVYVSWDKVPEVYQSRTWFKKKGIVIPENAPPDAIKGGGNFPRFYLLYSTMKYLKQQTK